MALHKNIFVLFFIFLFCGCDIIFQPQGNKTQKEKSKFVSKQEDSFGDKINSKNIEIAKLIRADLFSIVAASQTQNIHLAGVLGPTEQSSRYNRFLKKKYKFSKTKMKEVNKKSLEFIKQVAHNRTANFKVFKAMTNESGVVIATGDIIFSDGSSLSEKLIENGLAVYFTEDGVQLPYLEKSEKIAQNSEKGLWKNSMPLGKRFRVECNYEFKTLNVQTEKIRSQTASSTSAGRPANKSGHVLERHRTFEKQAEINIKIEAQKPVQRTYHGIAEYTFYTVESVGKRQQEISLATPRGTLKRDGTYKQLSSNDKKKKRHDDRKIRDYNKKVKGQTVYSDAYALMNSKSFELNSLTTNLIFTSDIVEFTESKKAGVNYETGTRYVGYDLEVWIEDSLIYSHKLKR